MNVPLIVGLGSGAVGLAGGAWAASRPDPDQSMTPDGRGIDREEAANIAGFAGTVAFFGVMVGAPMVSGSMIGIPAPMAGLALLGGAAAGYAVTDAVLR